jgi:hypothetical protein
MDEPSAELDRLAHAVVDSALDFGGTHLRGGVRRVVWTG